MWDMGSCITFDRFLGGKTPANFSTTNLDHILCGWPTSSTPWEAPGAVKNISFGTANYTIATGQPCLNTSWIGRGWTVAIGSAV
jgi:hypothetical protein